MKKPRCMQTGKRIYYSKNDAQDTADYLKAAGQSMFPLRVYLCEFCNHWHITHKKQFRF